MATARGNGSGIHVRTFGSLLGMIVALLALFNTVRNSNAANGCRFQGDKCGPGLKPCCPVLRCVDLDENGFGTCTQPRNGPDDDDDETDNTSGIPVTTVAVNVTSPTTRGPAMCTSSGQKCGPAIYAPCCSGLQCENVKASDDYGVCHRRVGGFDLTDSDSSCNFKYSTCFPCATQETAPNALYVEKRLLWPNKTVPYKFYSDDFDKWEILKIHQAMDAIQELTAGCVRFAERKKVKPEKDFVTFGKDEQLRSQRSH
ncbi:uncharacterized protein LOC129591502 [Paramacrobiotus metropolitanus]|uniref:uncharacterized protein LOC129591502 n=1 Tax=Paramacrobiotus metropolitanus TaxID=2943436 RepID=UPI002445BDD8|nr:uncharacterized protein LOC129591502 [Paramacrobiotus metropolitanus]